VLCHWLLANDDEIAIVDRSVAHAVARDAKRKMATCRDQATFDHDLAQDVLFGQEWRTGGNGSNQGNGGEFKRLAFRLANQDEAAGLVWLAAQKTLADKLADLLVRRGWRDAQPLGELLRRGRYSPLGNVVAHLAECAKLGLRDMFVGASAATSR
jgi:hypothetical protein